MNGVSRHRRMRWTPLCKSWVCRARRALLEVPGFAFIITLWFSLREKEPKCWETPLRSSALLSCRQLLYMEQRTWSLWYLEVLSLFQDLKGNSFFEDQGKRVLGSVPWYLKEQLTKFLCQWLSFLPLHGFNMPEPNKHLIPHGNPHWHVCVCSVAQSYPILCNRMDYIACQAPLSMEFSRQEYWSAISYSRGYSWPRDWTYVSCMSCTGRWILYHCATWEAP